MLIGVIFNKNKLILDSKSETWFLAVAKLYLQMGDTFFSEINVSFNGILFDKRKKRWLIFSNIQSERPVFYSTSGD